MKLIIKKNTPLYSNRVYIVRKPCGTVRHRIASIEGLRYDVVPVYTCFHQAKHHMVVASDDVYRIHIDELPEKKNIAIITSSFCDSFEREMFYNGFLMDS